MTKQYDTTTIPKPDYPFWAYDPEGDGLTFFRNESDRDEYLKESIQHCYDDGWDEDALALLCGGTLTHRVVETCRLDRPDDSEIGEDGCDSEGNDWGDKSKGAYVDFGVRPIK